MTSRRRELGRLGALALAAFLLVAGPVMAEVAANHSLVRHVIAGGGTRMESVGHTLWGTVGQPAVGPVASVSHHLCSGFWCLPGWERIYLPLILRGP
jgi:hypothetical protein